MKNSSEKKLRAPVGIEIGSGFVSLAIFSIITLGFVLGFNHSLNGLLRAAVLIPTGMLLYMTAERAVRLVLAEDLLRKSKILLEEVNEDIGKMMEDLKEMNKASPVPSKPEEAVNNPPVPSVPVQNNAN